MYQKPGIYRVRTGWDTTMEGQSSAYHDLAGERAADKSLGYKVYGELGRVIYPG